jgi:hypothetical protein
LDFGSWRDAAFILVGVLLTWQNLFHRKRRRGKIITNELPFCSAISARSAVKIQGLLIEFF